jgi:tRNA pseudouridine38-40 synthase
MNAELPAAIYVRHLWRAAPRFNARALSLEKRYRYLIDTRGGPGLAGETCLRVEGQPRLEAMRAAAAQLVGAHDFSSFRASGCRARAPECHLRQLRIRSCAHLVAFDVEGDRFLRKMVRNLVGWLLDVGAGDREVGETAEVLRSRARAAAGHTAPARGLTLMQVRYPPESDSRSVGGSTDTSC